MKPILRTFLLVCAVGAAGLATTQVEAARVVVGVGVGVGIPYYGPGYWGPYGGYYGAPYGYYPPGGVVVAPPPEAAPGPVAPDPIFYPKNGQSAAQVESDRQACNRWATTQPTAMSDAVAFQRATYACMEARGYSVR
jgi:hypothetical protein